MTDTQFRIKVREIMNQYEQQIRSNPMNGYSTVYKNGAISRIEAAHIKASRDYGRVS